MTLQVRVTETEIHEVLTWAEEHADAFVSEHEDGTYEEGVFDGIRWVLGMIHSRPDEH